jgi:hypothetical protein
MSRDDEIESIIDEVADRKKDNTGYQSSEKYSDDDDWGAL